MVATTADDASLLVEEQVALMATISNIYGIGIGKDVLKALATAAMDASETVGVGKTLAVDLLKLISGIAGNDTFAMGKTSIKVCRMANLVKKIIQF